MRIKRKSPVDRHGGHPPDRADHQGYREGRL